MKNTLVIGIVVGIGSLLFGCDRQRASSVVPPPSPKETMTMTNTAPQPPVVINGRTLTPAQLQDFEKLYRVQPRPGNYWYDARSGLYGTAGAAAAGFMYPGHDLGTLAADASAGTTEVYLNGRNLTVTEVQILTYLAQTPIPPGRYWLDAQGNTGYEGYNIPVGNLFAAARMAQQRGGGGGGGDNFWTSRFSAGNYNADNSQGYVSVPGIGPVGYGF
jgi:hypothetical protein